MMRWRLLSIVLLSISIPLAAQAPRELQGEVFWLEGGEKRSAPGLQVTLKETGNSDTTNDHGFFRLPLPNFFKAGETVTLVVDKPGWLIRYPLEGEVRIPHDPKKTIVEVELLPKGSKLFWTNDRIEKFIENVAKDSARQTRLEDALELELSRAIKEWAERYGLNVDEAREEIDRWIAEVEAASDDERELGLADFARENFESAADHFDLAAKSRIERLAKIQSREERLQQRKKDLRRKIAEDIRLKASAHYNAYRFDAAIAAYQQVFDYLSRDEASHLWAMTQNNLGSALQEQGIRMGGEQGARLLGEAVDAYRLALQIFTREHLPQGWAMTQNNLGAALQEQGIRTGGKEGASLLGEAVGAYRLALQVFTRDQLPQDWAMTQNNLGNALQEQGIRTGGEQGTRLLGEAVDAYRLALQVFTREQLPRQWAMTQNNLGAALSDKGIRTGGEQGTRLLGEAVDAYRLALQVFTREQLPQQWAVTQNNLGTALSDKGIRTEGEQGTGLLGEAVDTYRFALQVFTREQLPQDWAMTQNNLGNALREQGIRTGGEQGARLLGEAVDAYRLALQVFTREHLPGRWIIARNNLGKALQALGHFDEAAAAFREVLAAEPENRDVTFNLVGLYHDQLYDHEAALTLLQSWLGRHPDDLLGQLNLTETLFATRRYNETEDQGRALADLTVEVSQFHAIQRAFEITAILARDDPKAASSKLAELLTTLESQAADFVAGWIFTGTLHFIREADDLPHRDAILGIFEALDAPNRDAMRAKLHEVQERLDAVIVGSDLDPMRNLN